ncbi:MAG: MFS transporter [Bacillota bacterium]
MTAQMHQQQGVAPKASTPPAPQATGLLDPLRYKDFRLFTAGRLVSILGDYFQMVALPMVVFEMVQSTSGWGSVMSVQAIPRTLLIVIGGLIVDRYRPRNVMLTAEIFMAIITAVLAGLFFRQDLALWMIYAYAVCAGVANAFFIPAMQSLTPELLPPEQVRAANALNSSTFQLARFIAPPLAGVLLSVVGAGTLFTLNAVTFAVYALVLWKIHTPAAARRPTASGSFGQQLREGIQAARRDPVVWMVILTAMAATVGQAGAMVVGVPALAKLVLGAGEKGVGVLFGALGAGSLLGAVAAGSAARLRHPSLVASAGLVASGVAMAVAGYANSVWMAAPFLLVAGAFLTAASVFFFTLVQTRVTPEVRGRVMGLMSLTWFGLDPLAFTLAGLVGDLLTPRAIFLLGGLLTGLSGLILVASRKMRTAA